MSDNLIIAAFRDALHREKLVTKEEYITKIDNSSLTDVQKSLCREELNLIAWEFNLEFYSEQDLLYTAERIEKLSLEEKNVNASKWNKMQGALESCYKLSPLSWSDSSQKIKNQNKQNNLIDKTKNLLDKMREQQKQANDAQHTVVDKFLGTLSSSPSADLMQFMYNLIQFRQTCKGKRGEDTGNDDCIEYLTQGCALLTDADLEKNYQRMRSPEIISLVNSFFTQRYIHMYGDDIDFFDPAFRDAFSLWSMNKGWAKANIYQSMLEKTQGSELSLSMNPEDYAKKAFMSAGAQFYTLLVSIYDCLRAEMIKRRLIDYTACFMEDIEKEPGKRPQSNTIYLGINDREDVVYRTHLSGDIMSIRKEDCLAEGINIGSVNEMFLRLKQVFSFCQDISNLDRVVDNLCTLSLRNFKHRLKDIIKKYFSDERAARAELDMLCQNNIRDQGNLMLILQKMNAVHPEAVLELVNQARNDLLNHTIKHYLHDIILKITSKRAHTASIEPTPFLSEWPIDSKGQPKKITLTPAEKALIGQSVKASSQIKKMPQMESNYWHANKPAMIYFGKMIRSLGGFFNPNSFCDFLLTTEFTKLEKALGACDPQKAADKKRLQTLHKVFQDTDLTNLITLIKRLKEGTPESNKEIYAQLSIKNRNIFVEKRFQEVIPRLYDKANRIMQSVREKLHIEKDYAYNDLEWKRSRIFTSKNSACVKRLLEVYGEGEAKKDFSPYTWKESLSLLWNPGMKLKEPDDPLKELMREKMPDMSGEMV